MHRVGDPADQVAADLDAVDLRRCASISRVDSPRLYSARIFSSNPTNRRWRLLTIFGSKLPSRSRGASIWTLPVLGDQRLRRRAVARVARAARRLAVRLVADVVGQLDLHRPLHQPLGQLRPAARRARRSPPRSLAPASSSSITSSLIRRSAGIPRACRTRRRPAARSTASSTSSWLRARGSRPSKGGAGGSPGGSPPAPDSRGTVAR